MFPETVKYTESEHDIQINELLYKIKQICQNTFDFWKIEKQHNFSNFYFIIYTNCIIHFCNVCNVCKCCNSIFHIYMYARVGRGCVVIYMDAFYEQLYEQLYEHLLRTSSRTSLQHTALRPCGALALAHET